MAEVRQLPPASERKSRSDDEEVAMFAKADRRRKCIKCWGGIAVAILIEVLVVVILMSTVLKVKDPEITLNGVTIDKVELGNGTNRLPVSNMTLTADVSVKNPNFGTFTYPDPTTTLYYHGTVVGEARGPSGSSRARRTARMNVTIDIITDPIVGQPMLNSDAASGLLPMDSFSRVGGRVKMLMIIKKNVVVAMNCTITVNITSRAIHDHKCKPSVKL